MGGVIPGGQPTSPVAPAYIPQKNKRTVPVAVSSPPTQSTPSYVAFFTAQIAALITCWSLVPSATKSG